MGIGGSIFLLALGAILTFAVDFTFSGINIQVIGVILMAAGLIGLVLFLTVYGPRRRETVVRDQTVYRDPGLPRDRDVY